MAQVQGSVFEIRTDYDQYRLVEFQPGSFNGWSAYQVYDSKNELRGAIVPIAISESAGYQEWMASFDSPYYQEWMPNLPSVAFALTLFDPPQC